MRELHGEKTNIFINETDFPKAFNSKVKQLMLQGIFSNEDDAKKWVRETPIEIEIFDTDNKGLYALVKSVYFVDGKTIKYNNDLMIW